ncbi:MAG: hypothetical protein QFX38_04580 [Methanothermobacter sp.]|nr:hypothetical protein [Methanothermobacter sp.]
MLNCVILTIFYDAMFPTSRILFIEEEIFHVVDMKKGLRKHP